MDDPNKIPDLSYINKRREEARRIRRRASIDDVIQRNRATLLINLLIEIMAGLVLMAGIVYTGYFLTIRRHLLHAGQYQLYMSILVFFSVFWFSYVAYKAWKKYLLYRKYSKESKHTHDSEEDDESL
jgi:hypothetical protein